MKVRPVGVFLLLALLWSAMQAMGQGPTDGVPTEEQIGAVLLDYSTTLSTGQMLNEAYSSPAMRELVQERRGFYAEFFDLGLHSDLLRIESQLRSSPSPKMGNRAVYTMCKRSRW